MLQKSNPPEGTAQPCVDSLNWQIEVLAIPESLRPHVHLTLVDDQWWEIHCEYCKVVWRGRPSRVGWRVQEPRMVFHMAAQHQLFDLEPQLWEPGQR